MVLTRPKTHSEMIRIISSQFGTVTAARWLDLECDRINKAGGRCMVRAGFKPFRHLGRCSKRLWWLEVGGAKEL